MFTDVRRFRKPIDRHIIQDFQGRNIVVYRNSES